jgi:hypothetical protein
VRRLIVSFLMADRPSGATAAFASAQLASYGVTVGPSRFASGLWKREYVRCTFASSAARPAAGAAAIRPRSLFRFFFRC